MEIKRADGRTTDQLRPMTAELGPLNRADGSARFVLVSNAPFYCVVDDEDDGDDDDDDDDDDDGTNDDATGRRINCNEHTSHIRSGACYRMMEMAG